MTSNCYSMVRGRVARFTLLDARGRPVEGQRSVITTRGLVRVELEERVEEGSTELIRDEITDAPRMILRGKAKPLGFEAGITMVGVDPDLIEMLSNQTAVLNALGDVVGNDVATGRPISNFAVEIWSRLSKPVNGYSFGYTVFPRMRGGRVGGVSLGEGTANFTVVGARTTRMSRWGNGPLDLDQGERAACVPEPLPGGVWDSLGWDLGPWDVPADTGDEVPLTPRRGPMVGGNLHWRNFLVSYAPIPTVGAQPLYDAIDGGTASSTSADVFDGQFVETSSDVVEGGMAA